MIKKDAVICGAGIAGISAAYFLAAQNNFSNILVIDQGSPLSLTSDKSTEAYRNWWPGPGNAMVSLMNRSIDLLEELARQNSNFFHLNRRGYLYVSSKVERIASLIEDSKMISSLGAGPLRIHDGRPSENPYQPASLTGYEDQPTGADLILDPALIQHYFPYLSPEILSALHVRRAGWFSAQQLGMYLLKRAQECQVELLTGEVVKIQTRRGKIYSIHLKNGQEIHTSVFINAAGPFLPHICKLLEVDIPVFSELHLKVSFRDVLGVIPRNAPLLIYTDPQIIHWQPEEQDILAEDDETNILLGELPGGAHTRPDGGYDSQIVLLLWEYTTRVKEPVFPIPIDTIYPEVALRGLIKMLPKLEQYIGRLPRPVVDGGYYTRTPENRPLIGSLPIDGTYIIGALSGFGMMAAAAAGELLASHIVHSSLPPYAPAFSLDRYANPEYQHMLNEWNDTGQL
jgi:glycine/D-amino acid oxidase-like deaminating enzyme